MISCSFFQFRKKKKIGPNRTVPSRGGPAPGGQRWDGFGFFEFGPCGTVDRPSPDRLQSTINRCVFGSFHTTQ
jgi:hypothetical protein